MVCCLPLASAYSQNDQPLVSVIGASVCRWPLYRNPGHACSDRKRVVDLATESHAAVRLHRCGHFPPQIPLAQLGTGADQSSIEQLLQRHVVPCSCLSSAGGFPGGFRLPGWRLRQSSHAEVCCRKVERDPGPGQSCSHVTGRQPFDAPCETPYKPRRWLRIEEGLDGLPHSIVDRLSLPERSKRLPSELILRQ
jgi:hypothetical protein